MKEQYIVTIGIPVYNSFDYILDTMNSALAQTFPDIEFLIVDDCGNDGTMDVISNILMSHPRGKDIRIIRNNANQGVSYSRNRIIDEAKGDYLFFMDSDDTIEPNTILLLYDAINNNSAQVAYASYEIIDMINDGPKEIYQKTPLVLSGENELAMYALKNNQIFHVSACNHLIDLSFLRQTGIRFMDVSYWEDMAYTTELVTKVTKSVLLSDVTYHYFRRQGSLSHYQTRDTFEKTEILNNFSVIKFLKDKCRIMHGKPYLSYLCYNLEMDCFYAVCHIIRNSCRITPKISLSEMRDILRHPLSMIEILRFKHKMFPNLVFCVIANLPIPLFLSSIWLLGKFKRSI